MRGKSSTRGASTKLQRMASVIGIRTSRPRYKPATTTTDTARVVSPRRPGVSAGATCAQRGLEFGMLLTTCGFQTATGGSSQGIESLSARGALSLLPEENVDRPV